MAFIKILWIDRGYETQNIWKRNFCSKSPDPNGFLNNNTVNMVSSQNMLIVILEWDISFQRGANLSL